MSSKKTSLSVIRLCGMEVPLSNAWIMIENLYLTISYLLKDEQKDLDSKSHG